MSRKAIKRALLHCIAVLPILYLFVLTWQTFLTFGGNLFLGEYGEMVKQTVEAMSPAYTLFAAIYAMPLFTLGCLLSLIVFFSALTIAPERVCTRMSKYLLFLTCILLCQLPIGLYFIVDNAKEFGLHVVCYMLGSLLFMAYFIPLYEWLFRNRSGDKAA